MELDLLEMWHAASPAVKVVVVTMIIMGFGCVYVSIERLIALGRARTQSRKLAAAVGEALSQGPAAAVAVAKAEEYKDAYLGRLLIPALSEFEQRPDKHGIEAAERAIDRVTITEGAELRKGFGILATTGATCPFVGLVGTIFGIIGAFQAMSEGGGDIDKLLVPIAEALVATAIGITVAIMGVWLFNYFNARVEAITKDMSTSSLELIDWCEKRILSQAGSAAK